MNWSAADFWDFSLAQYANPGVKQACLQLQDEHGFNVNLILLCGYLDAMQQSLSTEQLQQLEVTLHATDQVLAPLRNLRKSVKTQDDNAYQQLLQAELLLEREQQRQLVASVKPLSANHDSDDSALHLYLATRLSPESIASWLSTLAALATGE